MVKAIVNIDENTNRLLNIVKATYGLKDKSQAIEVMAKEYEEAVFEPKVKASYIKKLKKIQKERSIGTFELSEFKKRYKMK